MTKTSETVSHAELEQAVAKAAEYGVALAKKRFEGIAAIEGASYFPTLARLLAIETDFSTDVVKRIFAAVMKDKFTNSR